VVSSNTGYDDPSARFPKREVWKGIDIFRISSLNLGKKTRLRRAINFASFLMNCTTRLAFLPRFDAVVALTSPPLISVLGALAAQLKGGRFVFWVMDLNPDEAIAAGWLKEGSFTGRILSGLLGYSLRHADEVVVLDRFMKQRVLAKGIRAEKVTVLPPWSHDDSVRYDEKGREAFRQEHGLADRFVVMYSGNHSPCHPLDTLLEAARQLSNREVTQTVSLRSDPSDHANETTQANSMRYAFYFVGGGSEQQKVKNFAEHYQLRNVKCLPYQPLSELSKSLSAADLHAVVMGDKFAGIVHPSKVYNILSIGVPLLYIGPAESHVMDIAAESNGFPLSTARNGDVDAVVNHILNASTGDVRVENSNGLSHRFARESVLPQMIAVVEKQAKNLEIRI
jgi:glycosyltransferase involved in cell wall biosynthesis